GQPRHTVRGQFAAGFAPHKPFGANPFDAGFCDSFRFTWHSFLFPDDFDCFGNPFFSHASSPARSTDTFGLIPCLPACQARLLRVGGIADAFGFFRVSSVGSAPGRGIFPFSRESRAASHLTSVARWLDVQPYPLLGTWRALAL